MKSQNETKASFDLTGHQQHTTYSNLNHNGSVLQPAPHQLSTSALQQQDPQPGQGSSEAMTTLDHKLLVLQQQLAELDDETARLTEEQTQINEESESIKHETKALFARVATEQESKLLQTEAPAVSQLPVQKSEELGEIHSLYTDLFLTDIRQDVQAAQLEMKQCKQEQREADLILAKLKHENINLMVQLKRYKKNVQGVAMPEKANPNDYLNKIASKVSI